MADDKVRKFYVCLIEKDEIITAHAVSVGEPPKIDDLPDEDEADEATVNEQNSPLVIESDPTDFRSVLLSFSTVMETYREFIPFFLQFAPAASAGVAHATVAKFARDRGKLLEDLSVRRKKIYELDLSQYRSFVIANERVISAIHGTRHLPEIMLIGLVSTYDAYLSRLLRVILHMHDEIVMTSEKTIKYSELASYGSIDAARTSLIDAEVEAVIRLSHHEQFAWMERKFAMKLRERLEVWPKFVELCERRNLVTHTGGIVSKQYLSNCEAHKAFTKDVEVGQKLVTDREYYRDAVLAVYEVGMKLGHVMWRKFDKKDQVTADENLNESAYDLIFKRQYSLAEKLLEFGTETVKNHPSDKNRRMMLINRANCLRLMGKTAEAKKILKREDWSATSLYFQISVAAAGGDVDDLISKMREAGANGDISIEDYRAWPLFRKYRVEEPFLSVFEEIFGAPVIPPKSVIGDPAPTDLVDVQSDVGTVH